MLNYALLLVLITEVAFVTYFDKKIFGNYFSPVVILSYPLVFIVTLALIFSPYMGFTPISSSVMFLCIIGVAIFWFGSVFWSVIIPSRVLQQISGKFDKSKIQVSYKLKTILQIFAWMIIVFMLFNFMLTLRRFGGIAASGSDEFTFEYGGGGLQGHILGLAIPLLIFFIGIAKKKDYITLISIVFLILICLLYRVKTWLFVPIIGGVLLRFFNERKFRFKPLQIILSVIVVVLLFLLTYSFSVKADNYDFFGKIFLLLKHFVGYLFAGVSGFNEHIKQGLPIGEKPDVLFKPFINMYNYFISGNKITGVVSSYNVLISQENLLYSNVKTFFGTIFIHGGYIIGIVYTLVVSIGLYLIWIIASISKNYWFIVLYVFFAAALVLGWFDFYYNQLTFIELPVYIAILIFLTNKKQKVSS